MFGLLFARVFEALIPLYLRKSIDSLSTDNPLIAGPALAILLCVIARFVIIISSRRLIRRIGIAVAYDLRKRIYNHLQKQGPDFFSRFTTGDLMARAINDIQLVRILIGQGTRAVVVLLFCAAIGLVFMIRLSPALSLLILPPLPIITIAAYYFSKKVFDRSIIVQEGFSSLSEYTQENLNGIRTVQAQGQEEHEIKRFADINSKYADDNLSLIRINSFIGSFMPTLGAVSTIAILGYGGHLVLQGDLTVGTFTAFFWYLNMVLWPVRDAGNMVTLWQRGASGTQRLFEILDSEPEIKDGSDPDVPPKISGKITIKDLTYTFPNTAKQILNGISLEVEAGEMVAVLGRIGSGKSTLLKMFVRLLDPPEGTLLLDGHDIRSYSLSQLRSQVALVFQEPFLFADSIRVNLSYDDPERKDDIIWRAADNADLRATLLDLPENIDTVVGERGVTLSGGQKQRSALARGIIRNAPILLLDDCFSSVDTETEERILSRLKELRKHYTTFLVSHRVSTVRHADRIIVLNDGVVTEAGTHDELIALDGHYARIEKVQSLKDSSTRLNINEFDRNRKPKK